VSFGGSECDADSFAVRAPQGETGRSPVVAVVPVAAL